VRNAFPAVKLVKTNLNGRQKLQPIRNLAHRGIVGKLSDGLQNHFFLRHTRSLGWRHRLGNIAPGSNDELTNRTIL
jgi:hypothetical protein